MIVVKQLLGQKPKPYTSAAIPDKSVSIFKYY